MNRRAVLVVVPAAVVVAGFGDGHAKAAASSVVRTASGPGTPVGRAADVLPKAADGARLSACHTGRCEVLVSACDKIFPPARLGVRSVTVTSVSGRGVGYLGTGPGITLTLGGQRRGMTSYVNRLAITTVAVRGGKAVVRFAPR